MAEERAAALGQVAAAGTLAALTQQQLNEVTRHLTTAQELLQEAAGSVAVATQSLKSATTILAEVTTVVGGSSILHRRGRESIADRTTEEAEPTSDPPLKRLRTTTTSPTSSTRELEARGEGGSLLLAKLTVDLLAHVFGFLDVRSLCALSLVSSRVRGIADCLPWRRIFAKSVGVVACLPREDRGIGTRGPDFWKDEVVKARVLQAKWAQGGTQSTLAGHDRPIKGLQLSKTGLRCLSSDDSVLKEWDVQSSTMVDSFTSFDEAKLAISGPDAVRIYDMNTKDYLFPLATSISTITALHMFNSLIIGGSWDGYINIYSMENGAAVRTLTGHHNPVYCLDRHKDVICSGSSDRTIKVWNPETQSCLSTFRGHTKTVQAVQINTKARMVVSASRDRTVKVWDTRMSATVRTLDEHTDAVTAAQIDCMKIVSASKDATVRVWDLRSGNPLYIFEGHTKGINCLRFKNDLMVSAGDDKMVRVWQF